MPAITTRTRSSVLTRVDGCNDRLDALRNEAAGSNVHFLERDAWVLEGVRFLGCTLWTDYGGWHEGLVPYALDMSDHRETAARSWWSRENRERYHRRFPWTDPATGHYGRFNPVLQYEVWDSRSGG